MNNNLKLTFQSLILVILLSIIVACTTSTPQTVEVVEPQQFKHALNKYPQALLLDLRTPEEFQDAHLSNAIIIDFESDDFESQLKSAVDTTSIVFIYCRTGNKSGQTNTMLQDMKIDTIIELNGGYESWQEQFEN